jgi:hypothetical protein
VDVDYCQENVIKLLKCGNKIKMQLKKHIQLKNLRWNLIQDELNIFIYFYIYFIYTIEIYHKILLLIH